MRDLIVHLIDGNQDVNLGEMLLKDALRDIFEADKEKSYLIKFKTMRNTEFTVSVSRIDENHWQANIVDWNVSEGVYAVIASITPNDGVTVFPDTELSDGLSYTQFIFIAAVVEEMKRQGK